MNPLSEFRARPNHISFVFLTVLSFVIFIVPSSIILFREVLDYLCLFLIVDNLYLFLVLGGWNHTDPHAAKANNG